MSAVDPALTEVCGERPTWFCEGSWNLWHNRALSRSIDWFVTRPLAALIVVAIAALLNRYLRRLVSALITRVVTSSEITAIIRVDDDIPAHDARTRSRSTTLSTVATATVSALVWSIAVLVVLGIFQINLAPLLAGAGIAGIAVGFGAQSLVKDCISGFFMLLEDQCGVGDEVNIGACMGTIESLTLRMTRVRGYDGTLWSIPNGTITLVGNLTRNWSQGNLDITVWHDADIDTAIQVVERAALAAAESPTIAGVLLEAPRIAGIERVDQSGTAIRIVVRTKPAKQWPVLREMRLAIKRALDEAGIALHPPYERPPR